MGPACGSYLLRCGMIPVSASGRCCPDPPDMSQTKMTKGPSVFFSDNMPSHDHLILFNINDDLRFAHLRICDNQQMLAM